jgi:hypothetical protein
MKYFFLSVFILLGFAGLMARPAMAETITLTPTADSYVLNSNPDTNYGSLDSAYISYNANQVLARTLLKFDLSSIPAGSTVDSATLTMNLKSYAIADTTQTKIYRATADWTENEVTWTNKPTVGDLLQNQIVAGYTPEYWTVTTAVQKWLSGEWANQGMVIMTLEGVGSYLTFGYWTREAAVSSNFPSLAISYTPPAVPAVQITDITTATSTNAATVSFRTNVSATGTIEYGTTSSYGSTKIEDGTASIIHAITLTGLTSDTVYHFRVKAEAASSSAVSADNTFTTSKVAAPAVEYGSLVKTADSSAVYYFAADGKRHAFPNEKIYKSWYADYSSVKVITAAIMSSLPLGKNVTYRPGVTMVKFQSLAKTYAVSRGGELRWVKDEALAASLYGSNWNTKIDDVSDAFFADYKFGNDILTSADYSTAAALASAANIGENL